MLFVRHFEVVSNLIDLLVDRIAVSGKELVIPSGRAGRSKRWCRIVGRAVTSLLQFVIPSILEFVSKPLTNLLAVHNGGEKPSTYHFPHLEVTGQICKLTREVSLKVMPRRRDHIVEVRVVYHLSVVGGDFEVIRFVDFGEPCFLLVGERTCSSAAT